MKPFRYERASGVASACASAAEPAAKFIAGGTNLLDLMKLQRLPPTCGSAVATPCCRR
jgi:xanthine dehydrogenase YagS FAD-binding subunit